MEKPCITLKVIRSHSKLTVNLSIIICGYVFVMSRYSMDPSAYWFKKNPTYINGQTVREAGTCSLLALASPTGAKKWVRLEDKYRNSKSPHMHAAVPDNTDPPLLCQAHIKYARIYTGRHTLYNDRPGIDTDKPDFAVTDHDLRPAEPRSTY